MKGLLLKELYMTRKHQRSWLLMMLVLIGVSCMDAEFSFFVFYPCMLCGMIPVSLLGYDERSKWDIYAGTLPCSKAQIVSAKYLIGLMIHGGVLLLTAVAQCIRMAVTDNFVWSEYLAMIGMLVMLGCISSAMTLPFMFKFGVEKGRLAYYVMVGGISGISVFMTRYFQPELAQQVSFNGVLATAILIVIGLYALSWYLSIRFYEKRELK